jgi:hypothetical protein
MHKLHAFLLAVALGATFPMQAAADITVRLEEFGVYRIEGRPNVRAELLRTTDRVPLQLGTTFGVSVSVHGPNDDRERTLRKITRFPPPGLTDPRTGRTRPYSETLVTVRVGQMPRSLFTFDHAWEMVPGVWTIEYWLGEEKLAEKQFTVVKP